MPFFQLAIRSLLTFTSEDSFRSSTMPPTPPVPHNRGGPAPTYFQEPFETFVEFRVRMN